MRPATLVEHTGPGAADVAMDPGQAARVLVADGTAPLLHAEVLDVALLQRKETVDAFERQIATTRECRHADRL